MATITWKGGSADWSNSASWQGGSVPGGADVALIAVIGSNFAVGVGVSESFAISSALLNAGNATLVVDGTLAAAGAVTITAGSVIAKGNLTANRITDGGLLAYVGSHVLDNTLLSLGNVTGATLRVQDIDNKTPATLTLGPNEHVQQVALSATIDSTSMNGETVINQGQIVAAFGGGSMTIAPLNFINNGTISAFNTETLTVGGNWTNKSGTIAISSGATLTFAGALTTADIGTIIGVNSINLTGTLDNTDATLAVGSGSPLGTVNLQDTGAIKGGTIVDINSNGFTFTGNSTFDAVLYQGPINISTRSGRLTITNGLKVTTAISPNPGVINLTGGGDAIINFVNSQTIDNATINLNGTYAPNPLTEINTGGTIGSVLTFGPNLTVSSTLANTRAAIHNTNGQQQAAVVNRGKIVAAANGGSFDIAQTNGFTNQGTISISNGELFTLQPGSGLFTNTGSVSVSGGSTLRILDSSATPPISNFGTITLASGTTLELGGFYTIPSLGHLVNQGAITQIDGTLDGQHGTLTLGPGTVLGTVVLAGNITNATINTNSALNVNSANASLLTDTVHGTVNVPGDFVRLTIAEGVTFTDATGKLAGTLNVIGQGDSLIFSNLLPGSAPGRTVDNVTINVGNAVFKTLIAPSFSGNTFTVGSKASIVSATDGALASLNAGPGTSITLKGTLTATGKGGQFTIPSVSGSDFINNGTMIVGNGDTLSVSTTIAAGSGSGTIDIRSGGIADFFSAVATKQTLSFTGSTGTLRLHQPSSFSAAIARFFLGDTIDLIGIPANKAVWTAGGVGQPGTLAISNASGTTVAALSLLGDYSTDSFTVVSDTAGGTDVTTTATCYAAGTRILTTRGEIAVERLQEGDLVLTISGRLQPIRWIGRRRVNFRRHPNPRRVLPIRIRANAFGQGRPRRSLVLSPDHAVFVDDVLIPIRHLENTTTVAQIELDAITYYHIELPSHDVVLAEGMPAESYLEAGARDAFANGGGAMQLHPDFAPSCDRFAVLWETHGYAPLVVVGDALERARGNLARQAAMLGTARRRRKRLAA